jgi:hypothetical protein
MLGRVIVSESNTYGILRVTIMMLESNGLAVTSSLHQAILSYGVKE